MKNIIETERLYLRTWLPEDLLVYYEICQDPKVTEFLTSAPSLLQVEEFMKKMNNNYLKYGYSLWATCLKETEELIGFVGIKYIDWQENFNPAGELAWRLGSKFWDHGYATEAASFLVGYGFNNLNLPKMVAFTVPQNSRSIRVMEKIGMKLVPNGEFFHPQIALNHRLSLHISYEIDRNHV